VASFGDAEHQEAEMSVQPAAVSVAAPSTRDHPFGEAVAHSQTLLTGVYETCSHEGQAFLQDWVRDGEAAMRGLQAARSPLDLLGVQQQWLLARSCAWADAGARMLSGASLLAEDSIASLRPFHLPE
jgi:hypothetical protein